MKKKPKFKPKQKFMILCKTGGLGIERREPLIVVDIVTKEKGWESIFDRPGNESVEFVFEATGYEKETNAR